jgi:hypothetical protein
MGRCAATKVFSILMRTVVQTFGIVGLAQEYNRDG